MEVKKVMSYIPKLETVKVPRSNSGESGGPGGPFPPGRFAPGHLPEPLLVALSMAGTINPVSSATARPMLMSLRPRPDPLSTWH